MSRPPRRLTRAQAIGGAAAAAVAAAVAAREIAKGGTAAPALDPARHTYSRDFAARAPGRGWGGEWAALHYERLSIAGGAAVFSVPRGLAGVAADQPMPVFLTDRDCSRSEQLATFAITDPSLRPGVLLRRTGPFEYLGVTVEPGRMVVCEYGRERRHVLAAVTVVGPPANVQLHLRVRAQGTRLQATVWRAGDSEPQAQLAVPVPAGSGGCGVLLVHPTSLRPCRLRLTHYALGSDDAFAATPPMAVMTLTGLPDVAGGGGRAIARVWSALPARAAIEWSQDPAFTTPAVGTAAHLAEPPYTHAETLRLEPGRPVYWRAELRSETTGAVTRTEPHRVEAHTAGRPLVLLAASCAQFTGAPENAGYDRLLEAAPAAPAALVYQGDIGYPNNARDACYAAAPDFFADRFGRLLHQPEFARFRRSVPAGFTMDDHDYGPVNNADRTTVEPWTWALWNRIHADPAPLGYFDFRVGDVHCLTLDGRRYCDPVTTPNSPAKTKLGRAQFDWMEGILRSSDAAMFVVFSADIFATRSDLRTHQRVNDCFIFGWPDEYRRAMALFMDVQLGGRRVLVMSGDAHGLRVHYHPDPRARPQAARLAVVELVCAGLRARLWSGADPGDRSLDPRRYVLGRSGAGMLVIDPPGTADRSVTVRAIDVDAALPADAFPPLRIGFAPGDDRRARGV
ncbi:MAG TPA: alkaline phosphatase D family protein [Gaiellales bacterium]